MSDSYTTISVEHTTPDAPMPSVAALVAIWNLRTQDAALYWEPTGYESSPGFTIDGVDYWNADADEDSAELSVAGRWEIPGVHDAAAALTARYHGVTVTIREEWSGDGGASVQTFRYQGGSVVARSLPDILVPVEANPDILLTAALQLFGIDVMLAPEMRSLDTAEFRALHDELVRLDQITPEPEFEKEEAGE